MIKIGVLVSGGGSNLQAIIDACRKRKINGKVVVVISNKKDAYALVRAKKHKIDTVFIDPKLFKNEDLFSLKILSELQSRDVDLICLAGFLKKLSPVLIHEYKKRIMNIHPALLPSFGGSGMYGHYVHEAVIESGVKYSGATVHFVDEEYDKGPIIMQVIVPVLDKDTPETLAKRVLVQEHKIYPQAVALFAKNKLTIKGRRVINQPAR